MSQSMNKYELIDTLRRYSKVFIVKSDMTYRIKKGEQLDYNEDLGLLGFAFAKGKGIAWLKINDSYVASQLSPDFEKYYVHPSLARKGVKLYEVI